MGPGMRKLIAIKMSMDAIPPGSSNPMMAGVDFILSGGIPASARAATAWAKKATTLVLAAPGCAFKDEEEVAVELVRLFEEKRGKR